MYGTSALRGCMLHITLTICSMLDTLSHVASLMLSPPSTIPWYPCITHKHAFKIAPLILEWPPLSYQTWIQVILWTSLRRLAGNVLSWQRKKWHGTRKRVISEPLANACFANVTNKMILTSQMTNFTFKTEGGITRKWMCGFLHWSSCIKAEWVKIFGLSQPDNLFKQG